LFQPCAINAKYWRRFSQSGGTSRFFQLRRPQPQAVLQAITPLATVPKTRAATLGPTVRRTCWIGAAGRPASRVGIFRKTGTKWRLGYNKVNRAGEVYFVPSVEPRAHKPISARFLSEDERITIADGVHYGRTVRSIAAGRVDDQPRGRPLPRL
jgi:hypothetical protein